MKPLRAHYLANPAYFTSNANTIYRSQIDLSKRAQELVSSVYVRGDLHFFEREGFVYDTEPAARAVLCGATYALTELMQEILKLRFLLSLRFIVGRPFLTVGLLASDLYRLCYGCRSVFSDGCMSAIDSDLYRENVLTLFAANIKVRA